ncbi:MAG: decaprenyl-phosphate phosphoribosyltransferase [Myxococcota bacterium]
MSDLSPRDGVPESIPRARATPASMPRAIFRLMRPTQWVKNLLLFAALVFAKKLFAADALALSILGFVGFCLASSSAYVVNDLLDAERDRLHPDKRHRPIAAGVVSPSVATGLAAVLTIAALALSFWIGPRFGIAVSIYLAMTHFYSAVGKGIVILDVMLVASGFVVRAVAGALAIDVPSSDWFIVCTLFLALFLALSKRKAEMAALDEAAARVRPVLKSYTKSSLDAYTATSMSAALISYVLYVLDIQKQPDADFSLLWLTVPFVLFALFRYHLLVETRGYGEKPEEVALLDRPFQVCLLGFALAAIVALYLS